MTWGLMYVLHGLAGVGLIALIMVHVYFALRPEKLVITKSMISRLDEPRILPERTRSPAMGRRGINVNAQSKRELIHG